MSYLTEHGTRKTAQSEPMRADQVENSAGGYSWAVSSFTRLNRFLILGSEGGSYYASERTLTTENVSCLAQCVAADGLLTVETIKSISSEGRAPKNDPAIFALAYCIAEGDPATKQAALEALPAVCRIGTHLFTLVKFLDESFGKATGRAKRRAFGKWYTDRTADSAAYQAVKYRQRDGWGHRDVLRLAHPTPTTPEHASVFAFISGNVGHETVRGDKPTRRVTPWAPGVGTPKIIEGFIKAQEAETPAETAALISEYGLPREALNTDHLASPAVWEAMLSSGMPLTAMIRNLGNMTRYGVVAPGSNGTNVVLAALSDGDAIRKARVHPISVLMALRQYEAGHGFRGTGTWAPVVQVVDALNDAFYLAFGNVEKTGKRFLLALDVSGSMGGGEVAGVPGLSPRDASAAMALVTANTEPLYESVGFTSGGGRWGTRYGGGVVGTSGDELTPLAISPRQRLTDAIKAVSHLPFGGTDCALPMIYATKKEREIDTFIVYTDSETWAGNIHPAQALYEYRKQSGIEARLIVVGMVSNGFTIADPKDAGMLDVVGFDTATPQIISEFSAGRI